MPSSVHSVQHLMVCQWNNVLDRLRDYERQTAAGHGNCLNIINATFVLYVEEEKEQEEQQGSGIVAAVRRR